MSQPPVAGARSEYPFDVRLAPIDFSGRTALVTGGGTGIGLGLAKELTKRGCLVLITGRNQAALQAAQASTDLIIGHYVSDVAHPAQREALVQRATRDHPALSVWINNAGVQHRRTIAEDTADWSVHQQQLDVNLGAVLHFCALLLPHLLSQPSAVLINVTSAAAFVPSIYAPAYGATKAAVHHYTLALRASLAASAAALRVVDIVPPAVRTGLGGTPATHGVDVEEFCAAVVERVEGGEVEVGFDLGERARGLDRAGQLASVKAFIERAKPALVQGRAQPSSAT